jgi:hypothetical protein
VRGASKGEGLGNQFLATIREVDAVAHVVRCFEDSDITHVEGKIAPLADIETIETELMLADLDSLEKRVDNLTKKAKGNDKDAKEQLDLVNRALVLLRDGKPARFLARKPEEERAFGMLGLLTSKPVLYVCNVEEGSAATATISPGPLPNTPKRKARRGRDLGQDRIGDCDAVARGARRVSRYARAGGSRSRPPDPRRLSAARPHHLFHRRPEGSAGLDHSPRHQGRRPPLGSSIPISKRASSAPRPLPMPITSHSAAKPAPAMPASCGWKARNTSSPTATSCISGSIPSARRPGRGSRRDAR